MAETVSFDATLYAPEAIEEAARAFERHATIQIETAPGATLATIEAAAGYDRDELTRAFCNYALHETVTRRRQSALEETV